MYKPRRFLLLYNAQVFGSPLLGGTPAHNFEVPFEESKQAKLTRQAHLMPSKQNDSQSNLFLGFLCLCFLALFSSLGN